MQHPSKQKRILVVSQHFWPENFRINDIVEGFVADGITVDVLCGLPNYPAGEWFAGYRYTGPRRQQYAGAEVFRSGEVRRKGNTGLRIFLNYVSFPLYALFSLPRLHGRRYDAVFCYNTSPVLMQLPALVYARTHRLPLVTYVLDLWPDNLYSVLPVQNKLLRRIAQGVSDWFYRRNDLLIALSDKMADRLMDVTATTKRKPAFAVIPQYSEDFYACDTHDDALATAYQGAAPDGEPWFNILFTGNLSPAQDLENLIAAMAEVHRDGCQHVRVLIVGDGMSLDTLTTAVQSAGLQAIMLFCGRHPAEDIPRWTGIADALFAGLAKSDNLGLTVPAKITSYLAAGRPLLVAADGEARRAAEESGAALTSPAGDAGALAANIRRLAALPKTERQAMGAKGRACYQQQYSRATLLQKLEQAVVDAARAPKG